MSFFRNIRSHKTGTILLHIIAWFLYGSFIFVTNLLTKPTALVKVLFYLMPFCITFYVSVYCLGLYKKKGVLWSVASFFMVFIVMSSVGYVYIYLLLPRAGVVVFTSTDFKPFLQGILLGYVRYFSFALLYFYIRESFAKERRLSILQQEKSKLEQQKIQNELENAVLKQQELKAQQENLQLEYAFLRSQINPHFLHNTLNMLFSQALNYSPELAENILKLSAIMRYSLESLKHEGGKVSVQRELEHLQTLIEIYNLRFGNSNTILYNVTGKLNGQTIPPLSLITIVENAFKYGDIKDTQNPLLIDVVLKPDEMYFYCKNKKKKNNIQLSSHNIGITNLGRRLDASCKDKYTLKATDEEEFYTFELTICK
jgi:sensor histidine kinase YesM